MSLLRRRPPSVRRRRGRLLVARVRADTVLDVGDLIIVVGPAGALAGMARAAS